MLEFDFQLGLGSFRLDVKDSQKSPRMALFGPSGSGKTSLLNCIAGFLRPDTGYIRFGERVLFDSSGNVNIPPNRRRVGYVFQEGRLFPHMTVRANIEYGQNRKQLTPDVNQLCEVLRITDLLDRYPETLSAGERQRVALARAIAAAPELLLMDEPLASIDGRAKLRIMPYLNRIFDLWRIPFVFVSHSLTEVSYIADQSWLMSGGSIVQNVASRGLLSDGEHDNAFTNILEGFVETIPAETGYAVVNCSGSKLNVPAKGLSEKRNITLALPANDIMLSVKPLTGLSARNILPAKVQRIYNNGGALWAVAETGDTELVVELTEDAARELELTPGTDVFLAFKSHSITTALNGKG
ncbi:MAG: molybdenum ABC transporter ATP-binding protein [bacterium]|nr:molybdenum ABC transporter ATP-binding protein [bacterium]